MKRILIVTTVLLAALLIGATIPAAARGLAQEPTQPQPMTPEMLAAVVGTVISLIALLVPGVNTWFGGQPKETQQAIMAGLTVLAGVVIYLLACTPAIGFTFVSCPTGGIWQLLAIILAAIVPNQSVYRAIPTPAAVKKAKANRLIQ